ncbi:MAG: hypothetical protein C0615_01005 [Desulfuromonas sp.]|nr:MAG: hypothetical protein C0615_01005 [Desulfuromonas sp.]
MILIWRFLLLVLVVLLLIFCMSNLDAVMVKFLTWQSPEMPLFLVLLFVFFFGFFLALFWQAVRSATRKKPDVGISKPAPAQKVEKPKKEKRWGRKKMVETPESSVDAPQPETEEQSVKKSDSMTEPEEKTAGSNTTDEKDEPVINEGDK